MSNTLKLKVKFISQSATLPTYAHPNDSGMDLFACQNLTIEPHKARLIKTGLSIELPAGTEAQIRPKSGLALRHGISVLNSPGTIDEGYRGEIGVILINHSDKPFFVTQGMKVAQMVIMPVLRLEIEQTEHLSDSRRGTGGFGSTGE